MMYKNIFIKVIGSLVLGFVCVSVFAEVPFVRKIANIEEKSEADISPPPRHETVSESALEGRINFWIDIYTKYESTEGILHDTIYPQVIYKKIDLKKLLSKNYKSEKEKFKKISEFVKKQETEIISTLESIHYKTKKNKKLTSDENKIAMQFVKIFEANKFFNAANRDRIRLQQGLRDKFIIGLKQSGRYLPIMEDIFKQEGMPVELTRLPFVESGFNVKARSKVGASGLWQFMPSTGKLFLTINTEIDERNDPFLATRAAAKLLKANYEVLQEWPLAITAYNHGRTGMQKAVKQVTSVSIDDLIDQYKSRSFGFASKNFYSELLAAVRVEANADFYFGKIERFKPIDFDILSVDFYFNISDFINRCGIESSVIEDFNPALTSYVLQGRKRILKGVDLKVPREKKEILEKCLNDFPDYLKFEKQLSIPEDKRKIGRISKKSKSHRKNKRK